MSRQYKLSKCREKEYLEWLSEHVPYKYYCGKFDPRKYFIFWNDITRKLTVIPYEHIHRNMIYLPTNSPGTDEQYITLILAVNGEFNINYDEDDCRFDKMFNFLSPEHKTRIDIYVNRACKPKKGSEEDGEGKEKGDLRGDPGEDVEEEPGQPDAEDPRRGEVQGEDPEA